MRLNKLAFTVALALGSMPVLAADLLETYHAAQGHDAVFASSRAARDAGKEKLTQGRAMMLPSVNLSANSAFNRFTMNSPQSFTKRYNSHGYGVSLVQPLFREQNWAVYVESDLMVMQSEAQYKVAEQDLILRVAQAYFDVLIAQDNVHLMEAQKRAISEQLEQAKRNFQVGTATITDTYEAQARYDLILAQEIAAQSTLEIKRRGLQQVAGNLQGELSPLGGNFKLQAPQPDNVEQWVDNALSGNHQLVMARAGAELAEKEVDRNRGGHLPTIDLEASYNKNVTGFNSVSGNPADSEITSVAVKLNMPLFQGGATQSKWREAEANRDRAQQDLENARRNVEVQTRQAYLGVVNGIAQVQALQQALKSSESLLEASKLGHEVGVRTNLDVLNAQQQAYSTRRDLYQAQYNYLMSQLRLKAAVGNLTEDDVVGVNLAFK